MWKRIGLCAGCVSLIAVAGCSSLSGRIGELEEETARLRQELAALQRGDTVKIADLFELYWDNNYNRLNPVLQRRYLDTIVLPDKPSPGDIDAYLTKLYTLRRINSDGDFQTLLAAKVAAVGRENLEKLLIYLDFDPFSRAFIMLGGGERKELLRTALGRSGRNSQLANLYSEIADASDADYILGMLEREPGFINAVKRLRLEKQALPVLKKRVMEAADGNRSFNYENEWLRSAVDAMPPDEQEAFIGSYWTKFQRSRNRSNNDWELRERAQLLSGFGCVPAFRYAVEAAMRQDRNNYLQRLLALSACPSMEEFVVWFRDNRDNLVFDSEEGIYKAAPAPSAPAQK
ncbi:hypothetical protein [uncultured Victivallis sp.]|uniref:hypothetical protein n=1 Tax=uncultured Victivallis sp. TaxID=354118 RepID=UPI00258A4658|nr:hypothetical protein [uncultured Victivallis sp.]